MKKTVLLFVLLYFMGPTVLSAQYSSVSLQGTWLVIAQGYVYAIFNGADSVLELGEASDTVHPAGLYAVSPAGGISGTLNLTNGLTTVNGNMLSDTSAFIYVDSVRGPYAMIKVADTGALAGTWSGYVYDSTAMITRNIQCTVNGSGAITSATGISFLAGKIFEVRDTFAGYITTSDTDCSSKSILMYGTYSANGLNGIADLGPDNGSSCAHPGFVHLVKSTTGLSSISPAFDFSIYPNPFTDRVEIGVKKHVNKLEVALYDLCGRMVYNQQANNTSQMNLLLDEVSGGIYLLKLTADNETISRSLVKN